MASPLGNRAVCSQTPDHVELVAGIYDELGIGEVLNPTIAQDTLQRQVIISYSMG